jgi:hypothetical protein
MTAPCATHIEPSRPALAAEVSSTRPPSWTAMKTWTSRKTSEASGDRPPPASASADLPAGPEGSCAAPSDEPRGPAEPTREPETPDEPPDRWLVGGRRVAEALDAVSSDPHAEVLEVIGSTSSPERFVASMPASTADELRTRFGGELIVERDSFIFPS